MSYIESNQTQVAAKTFNSSPEALHNAVLLRNSLEQWQVSQLKKLRCQLQVRCTESMRLQWHIKENDSHQKQSHFTLDFPDYPSVLMRVEWFWGYAHESDFYWGVYAPALDLEQTQMLRAYLVKATQQAKVPLPAEEPVEQGWPLWAFFSADPLFTPQSTTTDSTADLVHPWLSIDCEYDDFVSLILQRYGQLEAALAQLPQRF